jgi:hypothetical protein
MKYEEKPSGSNGKGAMATARLLHPELAPEFLAGVRRKILRKLYRRFRHTSGNLVTTQA